MSLGITDRTSDGKPLGYQRLDRRGNHQLKNLTYHAWRTACKSTTGPNPIKSFYQQSRLARPCPPRAVEHAAQNSRNNVDDVAASTTHLIQLDLPNRKGLLV